MIAPRKKAFPTHQKDLNNSLRGYAIAKSRTSLRVWKRPDRIGAPWQDGQFATSQSALFPRDRRATSQSNPTGACPTAAGRRESADARDRSHDAQALGHRLRRPQVRQALRFGFQPSDGLTSETVSRDDIRDRRAKILGPGRL